MLVYANVSVNRLIKIMIRLLWTIDLKGDEMMPLSMAEVGEKNTIIKVGGKEETRLFLERLGFVAGATVSVVSEINGNMIVNIKDSRVAIGKEMANKIIDKGDVGRVVQIDGEMLFVQLNDKTQAVDANWKQLAGPGQNVLMFTESDNVKIGDKVVIENEDLCLKKDKSSLKCDIILCSL